MQWPPPLCCRAVDPCLACRPSPHLSLATQSALQPCLACSLNGSALVMSPLPCSVELLPRPFMGLIRPLMPLPCSGPHAVNSCLACRPRPHFSLAAQSALQPCLACRFNGSALVTSPLPCSVELPRLLAGLQGSTCYCCAVAPTFPVPRSEPLPGVQVQPQPQLGNSISSSALPGVQAQFNGSALVMSPLPYSVELPRPLKGFIRPLMPLP